MSVLRDVLRVGAVITSLAAAPGAVAFFFGGETVGAAVFSFLFGLMTGTIAGVSMVTIAVSEPERFPAAVNQLMNVIRQRRAIRRKP